MSTDRETPQAFGEQFLWGVATSSYQIEGAVAEDGRGASIWDTFAATPGKIIDGSSGAVACDHYHRYPEDIALMQDIGVKAYRFSIAWPRIIPAGTGSVNPKGLDFYSRLVDALLEAGITPCVTLFHWDLPQPLQDRGGWGNRDTAFAFADYARVVGERLADRVPIWTTHNEPWCTTFLCHALGLFAPGLRDWRLALQTTHHVLLSHGLAVTALRAVLPPSAQVGISLNVDAPYPASDQPEDRAATVRQDGHFNRWFLDPLAGHGYPQDMWEWYGELVPSVQDGDLDQIAAPIDWLGVNFYNANQIAADPDIGPLKLRSVPDLSRERTADREIAPEYLYQSLKRIHEDYGFPALYITENGAAFPDVVAQDGQVHDAGRVRFLQQHMAQAARAMRDGVPLKGYFVWSLLDNFEWASGYTLRYGITYVDYATQRRILKDSARWYREFIQHPVLDSAFE
jgi:beta-glucosidase